MFQEGGVSEPASSAQCSPFPLPKGWVSSLPFASLVSRLEVSPLCQTPLRHAVEDLLGF